MTKPRSYQTEAIIIKKTKLGEADRILTLYTPLRGKIQGVAKGVRRPRSKLSGHLELLTHSQVWFARGRNIDTITGCQTINGFIDLKSRLELTSAALYATELVNLFTAEHIENQPLFRLLLETMERLAVDTDSRLVLRYFELHLLDCVGYRPHLRHCTTCRRPLAAVANLFCPPSGGMLCPTCTAEQPLAFPVSVNALKVLRYLQEKDYTAASRLKLSQELENELEGLMRSYLGYLLEREVKSVAWLDSLREQALPGP
jgi:DNA repair protein RecO (recombination protein O)